MREKGFEFWRIFLGLPVLLAALFFLHWKSAPPIQLILEAVLVFFGYLAAVIDFREKKIPNQLVLGMLAAWFAVIVPYLLFQSEETLRFILSGIAGAIIGGVLFLLVYLISRKGLGGGDVKFMTAAGLFLGYELVLPAILYGAILSAVWCVVQLIRKKINKKDSVAFIPFLYAGILLALFIR